MYILLILPRCFIIRSNHCINVVSDTYSPHVLSFVFLRSCSLYPQRSVSVPSLVFGVFITSRWPIVISVSDSTNERPANAGALTISGLSSTMELIDVATSLRHVWIQDMDVEKPAPMMDVDDLQRPFSLRPRRHILGARRESTSVNRSVMRKIRVISREDRQENLPSPLWAPSSAYH